MRIFAVIGFWLFAASQALAGELPKPPSAADYRDYPSVQVKLGQLLFYDRVLSGTFRVSCATCHNHDRASSNGFRLDGKKSHEEDALAVNGLPIYDALKPSSKHAPTLFNLGAKEFKTLFFDGRISRKEDGGFHAPTKESLPIGLRDVLAVQALFPAVTGDELVGKIESDITAVAHLGNGAIWGALAKRVQELPDYWPYFQAAFPKLKEPKDISIVEIANSISAFIGTEWRSDGSAFDAYLRGDESALNGQQQRGMKLFYGAAKCDDCHGGAYQTDHQFHFVPSSFWRFDVLGEERNSVVNLGLFNVTKKPKDKFKIRTPSLRNVTDTAPYGHAGGVKSLRRMIWYHLNPNVALSEMGKDLSRLGLSEAVGNVVLNPALGGGVELRSGNVMADLLAFLEALSDETGLHGKLGKPNNVPSSLALD